jgi:hypothetical protein
LARNSKAIINHESGNPNVSNPYRVNIKQSAQHINTDSGTYQVTYPINTSLPPNPKRPSGTQQLKTKLQ